MLQSFLEIPKVPLRIFEGLYVIFTRPKLLLHCAVPYIIGLITFFLFLTLSFSYREEVTGMIFTSSYHWLQTTVSFIVLLFEIFLSSLLAFLAVTIFGGFSLERIIELVMRNLGYALPQQQTTLSFLASLQRGAINDVFRIIFFAVLGFCFSLLSFFPPLWIFPTLFGFFAVGYNFIDLPLALQEIPFKQRIRIAVRHLPELLGIGGCFTLLLLIPIAGILFMPVGYYVGTTSIVRWKSLPEASSK